MKTILLLLAMALVGCSDWEPVATVPIDAGLPDSRFNATGEAICQLCKTIALQ